MSSLSKPTARLVNFTLDLLFPVFCQGCGQEGTYLCLPCQGKIKPPLGRCLGCGQTSLLGQTHAACRGRSIPLDGLLVAADYREPSIQNLIWHLKYDSVKAMSEPLALLLTDFFLDRDLWDYFANAAVIPVPLHRRRQRSRGFNQAAVLALEFAKRVGLEYLPILERVKNNRRQTELPREERLQNVQNLFRARHTPSLGERKIILIDDVATTGATLQECAKVLRQQQPSEIWGLVVARN